MNTERFERNLKVGKPFEEEALELLCKLYKHCTVKDTSDYHRVHGRKYLDFEIYNINGIIRLIDAKCKKVYRYQGTQCISMDETFFDHYSFHANRLGVPCTIIFKINEGSRSHVGELFVLKDLKETPFFKVPMDNRDGKHDSYFYPLSNLVRINKAGQMFV